MNEYTGRESGKELAAKGIRLPADDSNCGEQRSHILILSQRIDELRKSVYEAVERGHSVLSIISPTPLATNDMVQKEVEKSHNLFAHMEEELGKIDRAVEVLVARMVETL